MTTYYIDQSAADDSANGTTISTPWKRCPGMVGFAGSYSHEAGDIFIFKGGESWGSTELPLTIANSGSSGNIDQYTVDETWYTGGSYTGPIFDENNAAERQVEMNGKDYIEISGLTLTGHNTTYGAIHLSGGENNILIDGIICSYTADNADQACVALYAASDIHDVTISNSAFTGDNDASVGNNSYAIFAWAHSGNTIYNLTIDNITCVAGDYRGINVRKSGAGSTYHDITIKNCNFTELPRMISFTYNEDADQAYNLNVLDNVLYRSSMAAIHMDRSHPSTGANLISGNIITDAGYGDAIKTNAIEIQLTYRLIVENNVISNTITIGSGDGNAIILGGGAGEVADGIIVRNNILFDNTDSTTDPAGVSLYRATNCQIYNNIIYGNKRGVKIKNAESTGNIVYNNTLYDNYIGISITDSAPSIELRNNIIANSTDDGILETATDPDEDYNLVYGSGGDNFNGFTQGSNSIELDPLFVDTGDNNFRLKPGSPAVDAGVWLSHMIKGTWKDIYGRKHIFGNNADIGASEKFQWRYLPGAGAMRFQVPWISKWNTP